MKVFFSIKARLTLWYTLLMLVGNGAGAGGAHVERGPGGLAYHEGLLLHAHGRRGQVRYGGKRRARAGQPGPGGLR